jgi:putative copper resistance protein D
MTSLLDATVLYIHLVAAVLFVGGSFFIWFVVDPVSYRITTDESARTALIGRVARQFGRWTNVLLVVLVLTGLYNARAYFAVPGAWWVSPGGEILLAKMVAVATLIGLIYLHGAYYGPRIVRLAREGRLDELKALRRRSRVISYANLALMLVVLWLAVLLQMPP